MARTRRSKKELIADKLNVIEGKIAKHNTEIEALNAEKEKLKEELAAIEEAEAKAAEEANAKEILKLIKAKKISLSELKEMIDKVDE